MPSGDSRFRAMVAAAAPETSEQRATSLRRAGRDLRDCQEIQDNNGAVPKGVAVIQRTNCNVGTRLPTILFNPVHPGNPVCILPVESTLDSCPSPTPQANALTDATAGQAPSVPDPLSHPCIRPSQGSSSSFSPVMTAVSLPPLTRTTRNGRCCDLPFTVSVTR